MKNKDRKGNIYSMLLKNYILFTLVLVLLVVTLFWLFVVRSIITLNHYTGGGLEDNATKLESGSYFDIDPPRVFGEKSFVIILDENGKQLFSSNEQNLSLTKDELFYIPSYTQNMSVIAKNTTAENGESHYALIYTEPDVEERQYIWDSSFEIIYSTSSQAMPPMNQKLFSLLSSNYFENYNVYKYTFTDTKTANPYTLLIFTDVTDFSVLAKVGRTATDSTILLGVIYVLMLFLFSFWLKRKFARPLAILQKELNNYEIGNDTSSGYIGPSEFCDIFDSYKNMAIRLNQSEEKRKAIQEEKQNMLAGVAHDLKTPITVIQGYAEALSDGIIPAEKQNEYQFVIAQKSKELNSLINTFYEFSKLEHPDYALSPIQTDICIFLRDYIADKYAELEHAGFEPIADIPEMHILCMIDRTQFKRALDNIVVNAVKHNPNGATVYLHLVQRESDVCIVIGDNGCGIPADIREDIFKPFVMGDASRRGTGSGLGLSVAKRIIEKHGGKIVLLPPTDTISTAFEITLKPE